MLLFGGQLDQGTLTLIQQIFIYTCAAVGGVWGGGERAGWCCWGGVGTGVGGEGSGGEAGLRDGRALGGNGVRRLR